MTKKYKFHHQFLDIHLDKVQVKPCNNFWFTRIATYHTCALLHYDVVDGNVNEFDEKANESQDGKTNSSCQGNFLEFCKDKTTRITLSFLLGMLT